jgi:hypothetical protein
LGSAQPGGVTVAPSSAPPLDETTAAAVPPQPDPTGADDRSVLEGAEPNPLEAQAPELEAADPPSEPSHTAASPVTVPATSEPEAVQLAGTVEAFSANAWTVAGRRFEVTSETVVEGSPEVGLQAEVEGLAYPGGRTVALRLTVHTPVPDVTFSGVLESYDDDSWRVNRQRVLVSDATRIEGRPRVGAWVDVSASRTEDGTLVALTLKVR